MDFPIETPVRPRRRAGRVGPAVAAVVAIAGAVTVYAALGNSPSHPSGTGSVGATAHSSGSPDERNRAATAALVEHILAGAPTLPGAISAAHAPAARLEYPASTPSSGNLIDRSAFWTAPGTMDGAITYYRAHRPTGMTPEGEMTSGNVKQGGIQERGLTFNGPSTSSTDSPELAIAVVALNGGVAVRVDADAIWIPTKPASELIGTVDSVDVTVDRRDAAPTVHRRLTGEPAQRLAHAIDALRVAIPGLQNCPMDQGFTDELVFHAGARTVQAVNRVQGCSGVTVTVDAVEQPPLVGSIDADVARELGLPPHYGD